MPKKVTAKNVKAQNEIKVKNWLHGKKEIK